MAAELARHGITCRIVDKLGVPSPYCRALGVTPRTLEVWEDMGIVREMIDKGIWLQGRHMEIEGQPARDIRVDLSDLPFSSLSLPQYETERILTRHLSQFGIEIERGVTLTRVVQEEDAISVTLDHGEGRQEQASFRYVIGCDGAHSAVRRAAGIGFTGEAMPYDFMLGDVHIAWDLPRGMSFWAMRPVKEAAPDLFIAIPLPELNRYRVSMLAAPDLSAMGGGTDHGIQSERPAPSLAQLQEVADRVVAGRPRLSDLRWSSLFRVSMRLADHYRKGNLFIAGDAAHIHPPTGGQGMNTGIQDAYNLAWKMALVLKQRATPDLLESYEVERRAEGADVIARTTAASRRIADQGAKPDRLADTQIQISYRASTWVRDDAAGKADPTAPGAGDRAPDCQGLLRHGVGFPLRLFEVLRGTEHVLLVDAQAEPEQKVTELYALAIRLRQEFGEDFGAYLRLVAIGDLPGVLNPPPGVSFLADSAQAFRKAYAPRDGSAWLVRPDGYIGWRGESALGAELVAFLHGVFGGSGLR